MGMKRWFWAWVHGCVEDALYNEPKMVESNAMKQRGRGIVHCDEDQEFSTKKMNFGLQFAVGGAILTLSNYDDKTDRWVRRSYLIPDGGNVSEEVGGIVALELARL
jgi:hypothetical protein